MFTKTIKKYMALGLVLAFCSASSMAADYTKTLTAAQYQPLLAGGYGLSEGIAVTGVTLAGCPAPAYLLLTPLDNSATTGDAAVTPFNLHVHTVAMDIVTKAKAAGKSIDVYYSTGGAPACRFDGVFMK